MSKNSRREVNQAWQQQVKAYPVEVERAEEQKQAEEKIRLAQERDAAIAARDWPESLAECRGRRLARLTNGNQNMAVDASKEYGFFGARLYMRGFLSALGPAAYERGER